MDALSLGAVLSQPWADVMLSSAVNVNHLTLVALAVEWDAAASQLRDALLESPNIFWIGRAGLSAVNYAIYFKRLLLLFWATWFSVAFLSNLADATKGLGLLDASWTFASGNWKAIKDTTARYGIPDWLNAILFAGVILWEGISAGLFWRAGWSFQGRISARKGVYAAFTTALLLWGAFLVADEIFIAYALEATHLRLFASHLVTLLAIELLPEA